MSGEEKFEFDEADSYLYCSGKYNYARAANGEYTFNKSTGKVLAIRQNNAFVQSVTADEGGAEVCVDSRAL